MEGGRDGWFGMNKGGPAGAGLPGTAAALLWTQEKALLQGTQDFC